MQRYARQLLLDSLSAEMRLRNYSHKTIKSYLSNIRSYLEYLGLRDPGSTTDSDVRNYLLFLIEKKKLQASTINQTLNALRFLFIDFYKKPYVLGSIPRPKREKKLPEVLSEEEVISLLDKTSNIKHKALLMLVYSAGLRVGEAVRIRPEDIDSHRMLIHIHSAKGRKDRFVQLAKTTLELLREYWRKEHPREWLFPGQRESGYLSERSAEEIFKQAVVRAHIKKDISIHGLRHSYATHLHEAGIDIRYIQKILGHASVKTTEIYTHISKNKIADVVNPLDLIYLRKKA